MKKLKAKIISIVLIIIAVSVSLEHSVVVRANGDSSEVDVIDSVVITELYDTDKVLAEWSILDPDITVYRAFGSAEAVKLFINWSDRDGTTDLHEGDYFTFVIPDIFNHNRITNESGKEIHASSGEVAATYSIYTNSKGLKEITVTFTDFVENQTNISGDFWLILYTGNFESADVKTIEFIINGEIAAQGEVQLSPGELPDLVHPVSLKYGYGSPANVINGYYIFEWNILLNVEENINGTGFNTLENYYFEDIIPPDSPHVFITGNLSDELNIPSRYQGVTVKEYIGSDLEPPEERYQTFLKRYYHVGGEIWANYLRNRALANGVTSPGIDDENGLNISDVNVTDKLISAKLGTLTRPTIIHYYTMSKIKISEGSLGDPETVKFFKNTFIGNSEEALSANLSEYYFVSGGSANSIQGDYSFTFTKTDESNTALSGAWFSLYMDENLSGGADRVAISDYNGIVSFDHLAEGIYYFREIAAPEGYIPDSGIYKVVIGRQGYTIYYGNNFENNLNDHGNRIDNKQESGTSGPSPVHVTVTGTKTLSGKVLEDGMFVFALRDMDGTTVSIAENNADGKIIFNTLEYTAEGNYMYTVAEVHGNDADISYSDALYTVTVTVSANSDGVLAATLAYPDGDILFHNTYTENNESEIEMPGTTPPGTEPPGTTPSATEIPGTRTPGTRVLGTEIPEAGVPLAGTPGIEISEMEIPLAGTPEVNPKTGDDANAKIWLVLLAAATGIVLIVLLTDFKAQKK